MAKFGNMFIVGFEGTELTKLLWSRLMSIDPAGVILFDNNLQDEKQTRKLIQDLKEGFGSKFIVAVDQEGGKVQRLRNISFDLPSQKSLGIAAKSNPDAVRDYANALAHQLQDFGFNYVFAPCVDLDTCATNPIISTRSLGAAVEQVSEQAKMIIETLQGHGIMTCAKHYPGHGDTWLDSHLTLPRVTRSPEEHVKHLAPFRAAIDAGVSSIMTAHVALGDDLPCSLSQPSNSQLRQEFGFNNLILSDEITMKALIEYGSYAELARKLLLAGNDLIIWNTNLDDAYHTAEALSSSADAALLARYEQAQEKIKTCKQTFIKKAELANYNADKLMQIALDAVEFRSQPADFEHDNFSILVNEHPKLERDQLAQVFSSKVKALHDAWFIKPSVIVFTFQATEKDLLKINKLREGHRVIHVSTDYYDEEADVVLHGASKIHYQAFNFLRAK